VGECLFWYRPTQVVPDKWPLYGCVFMCVILVVAVVINGCKQNAGENFLKSKNVLKLWKKTKTLKRDKNCSSSVSVR